jgi:hypothetical protein
MAELEVNHLQLGPLAGNDRTAEINSTAKNRAAHPRRRPDAIAQVFAARQANAQTTSPAKVMRLPG